ncbi:amidase [Corynebacterium glutamicum]|uniref:creatininase n=1 Tax=Corynebacterium TaxID=1716 RepID=UPI0004F66801|nr:MULTISPECIES: creatininase [Corynebacterium]AIK84066.1 amidase [Corynebacterium glutamicum]AIK86828.1 amidase [Corynebacterium glutamicum]AJE66400.1 amidase [Corynebacterium glutamicum]ALP49107.1 amidase [Corynebacterium glutamicum]ANU32619.1 creatininase [Corynebacterium glutamicum]
MIFAANMSWEQYAAKTDGVAIIPAGSCEQHGSHLPLSTDSIIATEISRMVAEQIDGIVLPTLNYGYRSSPYSGGGPLFPGTVDLSLNTMVELASNLLDELLADGFRKILFLSAHFENQAPILEAMHLAQRQHGTDNQIVLANWWDPLKDSVMDEVFSDITFPGWDLEHAAVTETSLLMHLAPELVHSDKLPAKEAFTVPPYLRVPLQTSDIPSHGALADAVGATAGKGKIIADAAATAIAGICAYEFGVHIKTPVKL